MTGADNNRALAERARKAFLWIVDGQYFLKRVDQSMHCVWKISKQVDEKKNFSAMCQRQPFSSFHTGHRRSRQTAAQRPCRPRARQQKRADRTKRCNQQEQEQRQKKTKIKITRSNRQKSHIHYFLLGEPRIFEMGGAA